MKTLTVKEIKEHLQSVSDVKDPFIEQCKNDERKSVQALVDAWLKKNERLSAMREEWQVMTSFERSLRARGYQYIAGIDEAGRGPLAGPVVAAAVILKEDCEILGLTDSKKLSKQKREDYYSYIMEEAAAVGVGIADAHEIDELNIYEASKAAMLKAVQALDVAPDYLLIDAMSLAVDTEQSSIIKGDAKSASIAAGACIAKVTRDRLMDEYAEKYPLYGFEKHKGYGTKEHLNALAKYGPSPIHRRSFAPVKAHE
ncbi:ribonuclease HII [Bacillus haynesii]|uniref:ribonuclease HII n=1 Tax=Bacillus haynesii TaxID=1925021 RepID=UPI0022812392|nr:ribonuclease HII [Bacillus haynesii]MCY8045550.1 ribonuclease HII [Bacillus haynesii]MCY8074757.1 ribonuclease HII [Bacillus haynesii]MCY8080324.1 ribonuclease HII [Bacillus haynesii]MCY8382368.1 ribonuclease HII [Bacillus haynesii]MCY8589263.1 ribonuclease HII [Bacillus haynesii]